MSDQWVTWIELAMSGVALVMGVALSFRAFKVSRQLTRTHRKLVGISKDQETLRKDVDHHGEELTGLVVESQRSRELHGQIAKDHQSRGRLHADLSDVHSKISETHMRFGATAERDSQAKPRQLLKGPPA